MQAMHWRRQMGGRWQVVRVQWNARGCTDDERPMLKRKLARDDVARVLGSLAGSLTHSLAHLFTSFCTFFVVFFISLMHAQR
jgi:hypothetical protein